MTVHPDFPLSTEATARGLQFSAMRQLLLHEAQEHELPVSENTDSRVVVETPYGLFRIEPQDDGPKIHLCAAKPDWLFMLKDGLIEHLTPFAPEVAANLRWSNTGETGDTGPFPPAFQFTKILSITPVGTSFLRVVIEVPDLSSYGDDAIHFRVVLPPKDLVDVEWPSLAPNGSAQWPKGDKALHRPVYTARWVNHETRQLAFDVFLHDGGRVTDWARTATVGATLAINGPGGGGLVNSAQILLFADETGFPAAARILEALPDETTGHAVFIADTGANCAYPITTPPGVSVRWLNRDADAPSLLSVAEPLIAAHPNHFLWYAAEKSEVQQLRASLPNTAADRERRYVAAYWTDDGSNQ
ncbi:siderophore-interacting protein [Phaeobacter sp.]|uniref:siderophore-interacting protein n=1 Tax=Phaeobacter sp. TaxID=1902409 RepID=UPI0025D719FD|nr:siderophore-interacting protein [Phaeobacter sp.]